MLDSDRMIPLGMVTVLMRPPTPPDPQICKQLYLELSDQYRFARFEMRNNVVTMAESDQRGCEIRPDQVLFKDENTSLSLAGYHDEAVGLFSVIQERLSIPVWVVQNHIARVLLPLSNHELNAAQLLYERLFHMTPEMMACFGRPAAGACLRLVFLPTPELPCQYEIRVEPYFRDPRTIYVEVNAHFLLPLQKAEELRTRLDDTYHFLLDRVLPFLQLGLHPEQS